MRRATVFRLLGAVLVIGFGAYSVLWWIAAGKIEDAAAAWRESAQAQRIDVSWQGVRVAGYPLSLRLELREVTASDDATSPPTELRAPTLTASLHPWNFHVISLDAPDGLRLALGPKTAPLARIEAEAGDGALAIAPDGGATIWLSLYHANASAGLTVGARVLHAWATLPPGVLAGRPDAGLAVALALHDLTLPVAPPGFRPTVDELGFGLSLQGNFPAGPLRQAAAAWRDSGGTIELDHLDLRWGDMQINGSGTLALDRDLQPAGGFSGGVSGFDQLLNALVAAGRIKASDARTARLVLAMLAKAGPDGRPEIATSLTIQDGQMFLGPAKLGPAPRIDW